MKLIPWRNKQKDSDIVKGEPLDKIMGLRTEMDRLFDRFLAEPFSALAGRWFDEAGLAPSLDMSETDQHVIVTLDLPGVKPEDVEVTVTGDVLTITGRKDEHAEHCHGEAFYHAEREFGSFRRSVRLPSYIDPEDVTAGHANGVLTVKIAKSPSATPRRITVKSTT